MLSLRCFEPVVSKRARQIRIKQMAVPLVFGGRKRLYQQAGEFFQSFFSGNIGFPLPQVVTAEITELGGRRLFLAVGEGFCGGVQSGKFFFQRIREAFWEKTEIFTVCGSLDLYGKLQLPEFYQIFEHSQVCLSGTAFKIAQPEAEELAAEKQQEQKQAQPCTE